MRIAADVAVALYVLFAVIVGVGCGLLLLADDCPPLWRWLAARCVPDDALGVHTLDRRVPTWLWDRP